MVKYIRENHASLTDQVKHKIRRKFKQDLEQYKEEDIKEALRKGSKLVSYVELNLTYFKHLDMLIVSFVTTYSIQ